MSELTSGRMFGEYGASMDAALHDKVLAIEPYLVAGLTVDRGCGTGALMDYLAKRNYKVVGVEMSETLSKEHVGVINADINAPVFADGFASNVILSSVLHEVYSYKGNSLYPVLACLANCARELRSGGRIIIRDIWSPEENIINDVILLTNKATFDKALELHNYHMEATPHENELNMYDYTLPGSPTDKTGGKYKIICGRRFAVEFLSKKEYTKHWHLEMKETYTSVRISDIKSMADALGLKTVLAQRLTNHWIVENRWKKDVEIKSWPKGPMYTNQLIVLEKP